MSKIRGNDDQDDRNDSPIDEETERSRDHDGDDEGGGPSGVTTTPGIKNT